MDKRIKSPASQLGQVEIVPVVAVKNQIFRRKSSSINRLEKKRVRMRKKSELDGERTVFFSVLIVIGSDI